MTVYGDHSGTLSGKQKGGNQKITLPAGGQGVGDVDTISGQAKGGNDTLTGGDGSFRDLIGDAFERNDNAGEGNDILIGGSGYSSINSLVGDAFNMHNNGNSEVD